jgi:hypothetical protein
MNEQRPSSAKVLLGYLPVHFLVVAITWRDIRHRSGDRVRGSKRLWRTASALNTAGAAAYWLVGRRRP